MTRDRSDAITITYSGVKSRRRIRFEPRSAGGWERIEERHNGDTWEPVGWEIVNDVEIDHGAEVIQ